MTSADLAQKVKARFPQFPQTEFREEISLSVPLEEIEATCKACRDELGFNFLIDLSSVDHMGEEPRFEVVYGLYSLAEHIQLRLKTKVSEDNL